MRSIIFANYIARDTSRLGPTMEVEHAHVRFLGNLVLHLWDCGGQETFMNNYLSSQKDQIFKNVQVLIYVFDVESREFEKDLGYYQSCLEALLHNSPNAQAWSAIVYKLIPNVSIMEQKLKQFAAILDADEVMLFERATFLVIAHAEMTEHRDMHRFEKVSNIIKQFKLSCSKMGSQFEYMHVRNSHFAAFIDAFTPNTFIMVVLADGNVSPAATLMNIRSAKKHFEALESKQ
ncbi:Gtr1/RagA G protein region [Teladorsagia circumcincta]|uniref:Gtr1/RagA G protein region n=1 Tax=Teladorsagia circumcincta TaxID=45464 RepID=A0A2G9V0E6_TELCI|nr:Gtr1/RagA G protein region [Teladorsagia circumcincta]